jgi:hypothetical protein
MSPEILLRTGSDFLVFMAIFKPNIYGTEEQISFTTAETLCSHASWGHR